MKSEASACTASLMSNIPSSLASHASTQGGSGVPRMNSAASDGQLAAVTDSVTLTTIRT